MADWAILGATVVSVIVATCEFNRSENNDRDKQEERLIHNKKLQKLENKLDNHLKGDSVLQKQLRDSLGIK